MFDEPAEWKFHSVAELVVDVETTVESGCARRRRCLGVVLGFDCLGTCGEGVEDEREVLLCRR